VLRAVEACRLRAERDGIALELEIAPDLPPAYIDERAIEIALLNLIDNAFKYAAEGKRVIVSVHRVADRVELRVTDHGPGILHEDRRRIFERFVRGRGVLHKQVRGSGIGLALVKHIAEAHGGKAWVESAEPRGSMFALSIQILPKEARVAAVQHATA
jgi:two-component system, OmpR family, phosphate regulon sensor histidine kinase PhoR